MRQGTTPTHTFKTPCPTGAVKSALIVYAQNDKKILCKTLDDCEISDEKISLTLTQEETFLFEADQAMSFQVRILTTSGKALASDIVPDYVYPSLSEEVLE